MRAIRQSLIIIGFCFVPFQANAGTPDKTVLALETLAQSGSTRAQFELARRLEMGIGTKSDSTKAFDLYCKAASKGHPMAAYRIGSLYLSGKGVTRNEAMAASWFRRSIELALNVANTNCFGAFWTTSRAVVASPCAAKSNAATKFA